MTKESFQDERKRLLLERLEIELRITENMRKYLGSLIEESVFKLDGQYLYKKDKVWIERFKLDYKDDLSVELYKIKKNGENGSRPYSVWQIELSELCELEGK